MTKSNAESGVDEPPPGNIFSAEERDIVVRAISNAHDLPGLGYRAPPGRRAELRRKIREVLISAVHYYIAHLHAEAEGFSSPEFQATAGLLVEFEAVANALDRAEGAEMSGDETVALGVNLSHAWTAFIGDTSTRRLQLQGQEHLKEEGRLRAEHQQRLDEVEQLQREAVAAEEVKAGQIQAQRVEAGLKGAEALKQKAASTTTVVKKAFDNLLPSQRGREATALIASRTRLGKTTVREHLKTIREAAKTRSPADTDF